MTLQKKIIGPLENQLDYSEVHIIQNSCVIKTRECEIDQNNDILTGE